MFEVDKIVFETNISPKGLFIIKTEFESIVPVPFCSFLKAFLDVSGHTPAFFWMCTYPFCFV